MTGICIGLLVLAACSPPDATTAPDRTPTPAETRATPDAPSPSPDTVEAAIVARYLAFWDALAEAADPPDPDHPALGEITADPQLEQLRGILAEDREQGRFRKIVGAHHPQLRELLDAGTAAVVDDCAEIDPEDGLYDAETGERITESGEHGYRELLEARLELIGGVWMVMNVNVVEEDSGCDPADF